MNHRANSFSRTATSRTAGLGDEPMDNRALVATPENVAVRYDVVGPFYRLVAYLIDFIVIFTLVASMALLVFVLGITAAFTGIVALAESAMLFAMGLFLIAWFALTWFYGTVLETVWSGRTIGKWMCGMRVLTVDGRPINATQSGLRNFLRFADLFPFVPLGMMLTLDTGWALFPVPCMAVGLMVMSMNDRFQRLGDLAAGTMVITEHRKLRRMVEAFEDPRVPQLAEYIPPSFQVGNELANTLSLYVQRRDGFVQSRRSEIASHLAVPLLRQFNLPLDTDYDLLLCSLYHRTFLSGARQEATSASGAGHPPSASPRSNPDRREGMVTVPDAGAVPVPPAGTGISHS